MAHPDSSRTTAGPGTLPSAAELLRVRRRYWRFMATYRVEYKVGRHRAISFMANLSLGGMFLRSAHKLALDAELDFVLFLENRQKLPVKGVVRYAGSRGAGIEFLSDQDEANRGLRVFLEAHVIKKLEKSVAGNLPSARKIIELAALYQELDRDAEALGLYAQGVHSNPRDLELHEHVVRYLISRCEILSGDELEPVLDLLDRTVELGLSVKSNDILEIGRRVVAEQRQLLDTEAVEGAASGGITEEKRAEELRQKADLIDAGVQRVVDEKLAEAQEAFEQKLAAALEAQRLELDEKHRAELDAGRDDEQRQAIAKQAEALAIQETQLVAQGKLLSEKIDAQRRGMEDENNALEEMRAELEKSQTELRAQRTKIDEDLEARSKQAESERSELANEWEEVLAARRALEFKNAELRSAKQELDQKMRGLPAHVEQLRANLEEERANLAAERGRLLELQETTTDQIGRTSPLVDLLPRPFPRRMIAGAVALIALGVVATIAVVLAFDAGTPSTSGDAARSDSLGVAARGGSSSAEDNDSVTGVAVANATPALEAAPPRGTSPEPTDHGTVDDLEDWLPPIPSLKRPRTKPIRKVSRDKTSSAEPFAPLSDAAGSDSLGDAARGGSLDDAARGGSLGDAARGGSFPTAESERSSCDEATELIRASQAVLALKRLDRCLALNPRYARAYILVGRAQLMLGRSDKAIAAFEQVLKLAPDHKDAAKLQKIIRIYRANLQGQ